MIRAESAFEHHVLGLIPGLRLGAAVAMLDACALNGAKILGGEHLRH